MTWVAVGIGAAVGASAGAIAGSQKGGDDVWKGALLGGALGAAGGAPFGGAAAAEAALPAVVPEAAGIIGAEGAALTPAAAESLAFTGSSVGSTVAPAASTGIASAAPAAAPATTGGMGTLANLTPAETASITAQANANTAAGAGPWVAQEPVQMVTPPAQTSSSLSANRGLFSVPEVTVQTTPSVAPEITGNANWNLGTVGQAESQPGAYLSDKQAGQSLFDRTKDWLGEMNPFQAGILGFTALGLSGALNRNNDQSFGGSTVTPAGYPLSPDFKPSRYQPTRSYADGGIASADRQGGMYPQSQMDRTQFAVPSQMPISREVVGADYDATINPYTGDMPRFARGGNTKAQEFAAMTEAASAPQESPPAWLRHELVDPMSAGVYVDTDVDTRDQNAQTAAQTRMSKLASKYGIAARKQPAEETQRNMADGGITSLGGYAHGGNARLLSGPGDGMSDDIPATIADKQPARLADGEFVVPADVVSGLGNGSTEAGAKKLHQMMDKVRVDRTGTKKQGKQIKAEKYIPGMADGGIASYADGGGVFDPSWYLQQNPDVAANSDYARNPYSHYVEFGQAEGRIPFQGASAGQDASLEAAASKPKQSFGTDNNYWKSGAGNIKYDPYTLANRPSASEPQFYGNIYRGSAPDYSTPGYTLTGGNLGRWSNVAGEAQRAAQPASFNQQVTQSYLQNLGRAPDTTGFNRYMQSGLNAPTIASGMRASNEYGQVNPNADMSANRADYLTGLYNQYLGRNPEQGGLDYWRSQLATQDPTAIAQGIKNSPEAQVRQDYLDFLGREPESAGLNAWTSAISSGQMTPEQVKNAVMTSEEAKARQSKPAEEKKRGGGILAIR